MQPCLDPSIGQASERKVLSAVEDSKLKDAAQTQRWRGCEISALLPNENSSAIKDGVMPLKTCFARRLE
jgi:hypothetical protein